MHVCMYVCMYIVLYVTCLVATATSGGGRKKTVPERGGGAGFGWSRIIPSDAV